MLSNETSESTLLDNNEADESQFVPKMIMLLNLIEKNNKIFNIHMLLIVYYLNLPLNDVYWVLF